VVTVSLQGGPGLWRLLRTRRERPRGRRAAEHTEKFAAPHVSTPGIVPARL
jgi:hypothetical protein